ncbi:MAG: hypothetical protein AAF411_25445 [Myxococcota bacterium]
MSDPLRDALRNGGELELPNVAPAAPPKGLRNRLLDAATLEGRFDRFVTELAAMLDLSELKARTLLNHIDAPGSFAAELPGTEFFWLPGGPKTEGAVRGFVRVQVGAELPPHSHLGHETVMILQGIYVDAVTGERFAPGQSFEGQAEDVHQFRVAEGGTDLLLATVVHGGYTIGDMVIGPRPYTGPELPED